MSKVGSLLTVIKGSHVLGENGLRDYHSAKAAVNATRKRDTLDAFHAIRAALKNHRVIVKMDVTQSVVEVARPDQRSSIIILDRRAA